MIFQVSMGMLPTRSASTTQNPRCNQESSDIITSNVRQNLRSASLSSWRRRRQGIGKGDLRIIGILDATTFPRWNLWVLADHAWAADSWREQALDKSEGCPQYLRKPPTILKWSDIASTPFCEIVPSVRYQRRSGILPTWCIRGPPKHCQKVYSISFPEGIWYWTMCGRRRGSQSVSTLSITGLCLTELGPSRPKSAGSRWTIVDKSEIVPL